MSKKVSTTLIIPTYNWPEALELVLLAVKRQTLFPDEVIIADDGSTHETKMLVEQFQKDFPTDLRYLWHEDNGFQKSLILNKAVAQAKGDYIIQIDGDCIMHKKFIYDHVSAIERNTYLFGCRVSLKAFCVPKLYQFKTIDFSFFSKALTKRGRSLYLPILGKRYKRQDYLSKKVRGCNLSYWRQDYIDVNGYNEDITGWGKEDTEFVIRMVNNHVYGKRLKFRGIIFHIWHNEFSKKRVTQNTRIQSETINNKIVWCNNGIDKYLNE
ncbi:glycosyltransferase family 2 protein [Psychroserpens damuponensis]|uniref:glycosyltransferase family 2 protein n=1 Tax=Psychroserpens damuponensis TaxID=943936 RepID=UPI00058DE848|nr:glycosyltransferase family 2 protein [Psychroserpens damuponensis]